jgi:hypothetical protein
MTIGEMRLALDGRPKKDWSPGSSQWFDIIGPEDAELRPDEADIRIDGWYSISDLQWIIGKFTGVPTLQNSKPVL